VILAERLEAQRAPVSLRAATFTLGPGVHALVGAPQDGAALVLEVLAGRVRVRGGKARLLDRAPGDSTLRRALAYVPIDASLPDSLRVGEALAIAAKIRGDEPRDPAARLDALGLAALATRKVRTLARDEARAVAIAEALTSPRVQVILIDEPFVSIDGRATSRLSKALRARAKDGACVVVATASPRDAAEIADALLVFDRGTMIRHTSALDPVGATGPSGARLRVLASDARALLAELAHEQAIAGVETQGKVIIARGKEVLDLAAAIGRAAVRAGTAVLEMRREMLTLDELRAASQGAAAAAYQAAYERARTAQQPPAAAPFAGRPAS
jgi:ABC-2 type transport system ATP-binding protein